MFRVCRPAVLLALLLLVSASGADEPIAPEKAKEHANKKVTVQMVVSHTKNLLEKSSLVYLDSAKDFRSKENLAVTIRQPAADEMKKAGIDDPAKHYEGKTIKVTGIVKVKDDKARLDVDKMSQIEIVEAK
jgi:hypothetical protein